MLDRGAEFGEGAEALHELRLDAKHLPRIGVHPVSWAAGCRAGAGQSCCRAPDRAAASPVPGAARTVGSDPRHRPHGSRSSRADERGRARRRARPMTTVVSQPASQATMLFFHTPRSGLRSTYSRARARRSDHLAEVHPARRARRRARRQSTPTSEARRRQRPERKPPQQAGPARPRTWSAVDQAHLELWNNST